MAKPKEKKESPAAKAFEQLSTELKASFQILTDINALGPKALHDDNKYKQLYDRIFDLSSNQSKIQLYLALYHRQLLTEKKGALWIWKAKTLTALSDLFLKQGRTWYSRRYAMLGLADEARLSGGKITADHLSAIQLNVDHGLPWSEVTRYAGEIAKYCKQHPDDSRFPEALLLGLDERWKSPAINGNESNQYIASPPYLDHLLKKIDEEKKAKKNAWKNRSGKLFEQAARYVLSVVPGVRTANNVKIQGTDSDFDVLCSWEGSRVNFLQEFGGYFVAECKCWADPVPFSVMAKFARVLDEVRCSFGIVFTLEGLTGEGKGTDAEAEQQFLYLNRGICIVSMSKPDLVEIANGGDFFALLRLKYEQVRVLKALRPST